MQTYHVRLESPVFQTFRCVRAANSLDIDSTKKSIHELTITADLANPFNIGLVVGSSGSGKTTLAKEIFGQDCFNIEIDSSKAIIDLLPENLSYEECATLLIGIGLTSVPTWIRPVYTLSNGQRARAEAALLMARAGDKISAIDEWTSVVDRTVAKAMSHCVQKFARKNNKRIVLNSCHYDIIEWLDPDWVIDCNEQKFIDRRGLTPEERKKKSVLQFDIRECNSNSWGFFSKYHYLNSGMVRGRTFCYGLYSGVNQVGFMCFSNYVPRKKGNPYTYHSNRVVIHPDYAGLGLGLKFVNECCKIFKKKEPHSNIYAKFSSVPMLKARLKDAKHWRLMKKETQVGAVKNYGLMGRTKRGNAAASFRENVTFYVFRWIG